MKRFIIPFLTLGIVVAAMISCDKETSEENGLLPGQSINTSNCKACAYMPWCDQSVYTYSDTLGSNSSSSVQVLSLAGDTTIAGTTYTISNLSGANTIYHSCSGGVTTTITPSPGGNLTDIPLKESENVGGTWVTSQTVAGVQSDYTYTIVERGITRTVAGSDYPDVIHVKRETTTILGGTPVPVLTEEIYYARGVGLIENISKDANTGTQVSHRVLMNYQIP